MIADFGVSVSMRDSSKMTWRSASISLGSELEGFTEAIARHLDLEGRVIERGEGVAPPTLSLHRAIDVAGTERVSALEEHVLLEVGIAEAIGLLVAHAGADPQVHGDDIRRAMLLNEEGEPVRQHFLDGASRLDARSHRRGGRHGRRCAGAANREE